MSSNKSSSSNISQKKKPKNPIKFKVSLNPEQKQAKATVLSSDITVFKGASGSGKTFTACQIGLDLLFTRQVEKIVVARPTVSKEDIGFLPGDIKDKMDPWLAPIYHNLYTLYDKNKIDKEIELDNIEIVPFAFIRGRTFQDSFIIIDEAQNVTDPQMEAVLARLGKGSKMVICGDIDQIDLKSKRESGFSFLSRIEEQVEGFSIFNLLENHRHNIVAPILQVYKTFRD